MRLTPGPAPAPKSRDDLLAAFSNDRYRVRQFLGEGGKKRVYLARDVRLDRDVALSLIKTEGLDETGLTRVRREARAMGRLGDHANIVTVYDIGDEDGQPYIVSQYMSGGDVGKLLEQAEGHRLSVAHALRIASDVCRALEHAHSHGVIHRDLKPGNVWLTRDGTAKLGDFGLAISAERSRLTQEGMMVGTVYYMAPEQALGKPPDARADLYALGALLYEMVTGRPPFLGDDPVSVISQHINTPPVAPSWHSPEVPRALEALIMRLLAKAPNDRPESAAGVLHALETISSTARTVVERAEGEVNPLDRLASGVFVGREREMDELRASFEDALSGRGHLVLLVGEPGIGKTRTAEELTTYVRLRNAQVLWGRCYEGEGAPAYWPWVQGIRSYVHDRDEATLASELGSGAGHVAQIVSDIRERLPDTPTPTNVGPDEARFRLFDSTTAFLRNASKRQPLVLILDDLHWADKASLLLLEFVARELRGSRLLLVGTYRDVELGRHHPLSQSLGELAREQLSRRIVLRGLTERDVSRFIEITAGVKPPQGLVGAVYRETEGNPFFVNEVVRLLVTDGRLERPEETKSWSVSIPQGVREVVGRRLDHLSAACNRVLSIASVIGREFGMDALAPLTDLREDRLLEILEEAVAARVLTEVPRALGRYSFSHALIRETLYEELSTTRRIRLHHQVGETLESLYGSNPEAHLAELAYHFFESAQGGDVDRAIGYAVRAAHRAEALMAHEQAARHYELALQALELHEPSVEPQRCELLLALCDALWRSGQYARAKEVALQAAEIARGQSAAEQLARAALGFAGQMLAFAATVADRTLVKLLEESLAALGESDSLLRARLLARLAEELTYTDPENRRHALGRQAIEMARRIGDAEVLAYVLRATHWALWTPDNLEDRLGATNEIIELAERSANRVLTVEGHVLRLCEVFARGDARSANRELALASQLADEVRVPYLRWGVGLARIFLAFGEGRLEDVEHLAQETLQIGQEAQNENAPQLYGLQIALLLRHQGRAEETEALLAGAVDAYPTIAAQIRCAIALVHCNQGRESETRAEFELLVADDFAQFPRNPSWFYAMAYLSMICAFLGDESRAEKLYEMLSPFSNRNVTIPPVLPFGSASRFLGLAATTMGRLEDGARHFEAALEMDSRMGMKQALVYTRAAYADLLLRRNQPGDRAKAIDLVNQALDVARNLGMKFMIEQSLALKLRAQGIEAPGAMNTSIDAVAAAVDRERPNLGSQAAPDGTVTILFSDIENSTAMVEQLGDERWLGVLHAHNRIVRQQVASNGGYEVKAQGDGFMVAFQSARRALRCAIGMQRAFKARNEKRGEEPFRVRIGIHSGDVVKEADDFFGKNVVLAARITSQARGGEILVSSLVRELTGSSGEFGFGTSRHVELKGLTGNRELFPLEWS